MKKPFKITDELLLDYLDGQLTVDEVMLIEEASLKPEVASRIEELRKIDQLMSMNLSLNEPSKDFNDKIMSNLDKPIVEGTLYSRRYGLFILLLALLTVTVGSLYMTESTLSLDVFYQVNLEQLNKVVEMPQVDLPDNVNLKLLTDGLLFSILILSLLLLDKVVFRPFFRRRRTEMQY